MKASGRKWAWRGAVLGTVLCLTVEAQVNQGSPRGNDASPRTETVPKLPSAVAEVLKLSQADIGEAVIIAYVENSGATYEMNSRQIVHLRNNGVSEAVLTAMVKQRGRYAVPEAQLEARPPVAQAAPSTSPPSPVTYAPTTYVRVQPAAPAPAPAAPSTVYVIPYPAARQAHYGYRGSAFYQGAPPLHYYFRPHFQNYHYSPVMTYAAGSAHYFKRPHGRACW